MLGPRIAALRRQAGLNQTELAQKLGVSASAIGMYEQGRREPSVQTLVSLAAFFHVSLDFLLLGQAVSTREADVLSRLVLERIMAAEHHMAQRPDQPLSRQELTALVAAMLLEP